MLEKLGSAAEQRGGHRPTPRWREGGDPPRPSIPLPQLWAHPSPCPCHLLQSLAIKTASLAEAENMADLIDGYCRLQGDLETSLIVFPRRGEHPGGHRPWQGTHLCPPEPFSTLSMATASPVALERPQLRPAKLTARVVEALRGGPAPVRL